MDEAIKNICLAIKEEADAVISYTDKIASSSEADGMDATAMQFAKIRLDELEHIQNLTLELTKLMTSGEISAAENSGEENE